MSLSEITTEEACFNHETDFCVCVSVSHGTSFSISISEADPRILWISETISKPFTE